MSYAVNGCGWYDWGSRSRSIIRRLLKPHPVSQSFAEFPSNQSVSYAMTSNTGICRHKYLRMRRQLCSRCICKILWWLDTNVNMIAYTTLHDIRISREKSFMKLTLSQWPITWGLTSNKVWAAPRPLFFLHVDQTSFVTQYWNLQCGTFVCKSCIVITLTYIHTYADTCICICLKQKQMLLYRHLNTYINKRIISLVTVLMILGHTDTMSASC